MPLAPEYYTADMVRSLPDDGKRYELVWGELLVSPSPIPRHQRIVGRLFVALVAYCERTGAGETMMSPADISWSDDTLVQPDVFVVTPGEANAQRWDTVKTLRLVVEVLSPSTAKHDRFQKRKLYQAQGVERLWLVDAERLTVEVWTPELHFPFAETKRLTWHPAGAGEPLVIPVSELLR
jgi:Uma2 family endonuclease